MEPGEGSAAPKATVALPETEVSLAGRAPARLAVHCSLATGGPGAATPHAPFGRPRRPLGTFPRGESTSSARRRAKPPTRNRFLVVARERAFLSFFVSQGISPLRRRPKGFPVALWKPSGPLQLSLIHIWRVAVPHFRGADPAAHTAAPGDSRAGCGLPGFQSAQPRGGV